jgi:hypothetical protein
MRNSHASVILSVLLGACSSGSSGGDGNGGNGGAAGQTVSACEAVQKSYNCLNDSLNRFTDYAFSSSTIMSTRQSDDRLFAQSDDGRVKLTFRQPVIIPNRSFMDIDDEISFVAEKDAQFLFDYSSFTNLQKLNYFDKYFFSIRYPGKDFSFSVVDNVGTVKCDSGESYRIENLRTTSADCNIDLHLPRIDVSSSSHGPNRCGMLFGFAYFGSDRLHFRGQHFLDIRKPLGEVCQ